MTLSEALEGYRTNRIGQLENEQFSRAEKLLKLHEEIAALEAAKVAANGALVRAQSPYPRDRICAECWVDRGTVSALKQTQMDIGEEVPEDHAILRCEHFLEEDHPCRWYAVVAD